MNLYFSGKHRSSYNPGTIPPPIYRKPSLERARPDGSQSNGLRGGHTEQIDDEDLRSLPESWEMDRADDGTPYFIE